MKDWAYWGKRFPRCVGTVEAARAGTRAAYPDVDPRGLDQLIESMIDQHPPGFALAENEIARLDASTDAEVVDFALDILAYLRGLPLQRQFRLAPTELIRAACKAAATTTSPTSAAHALERIREDELLRCGRRDVVDRLVATLEAVVQERSCVCPRRSGKLEDQPDLEVQSKEFTEGEAPGLSTTTYRLRCPRCDRQWTLEVATDWERRTYQWGEHSGGGPDTSHDLD